MFTGCGHASYCYADSQAPIYIRKMLWASFQNAPSALWNDARGGFDVYQYIGTGG